MDMPLCQVDPLSAICVFGIVWDQRCLLPLAHTTLRLDASSSPEAQSLSFIDFPKFQDDKAWMAWNRGFISNFARMLCYVRRVHPMCINNLSCVEHLLNYVEAHHSTNVKPNLWFSCSQKNRMQFRPVWEARVLHVTQKTAVWFDRSPKHVFMQLAFHLHAWDHSRAKQKCNHSSVSVYLLHSVSQGQKSFHPWSQATSLIETYIHESLMSESPNPQPRIHGFADGNTLVAAGPCSFTSVQISCHRSRWE